MGQLEVGGGIGEVHKVQHMPVRSGTVKQIASVFKQEVRITTTMTTDFTNFETLFLHIRTQTFDILLTVYHYVSQ
jgi:hypothetical protein